MRYYKISFILVLSTFAFSMVYFLRKIVDTDYHSFKKIVLFSLEKNNDLNFLESYDTIDFENFPYDLYLNSSDYTQYSQIMRSYNILYSITKNDFFVQSVISEALTNKLSEKIHSSDLDTLNAILLWVDKFNVYADFNDNTYSLFRAVYDYWYNYVANKLKSINNNNPDKRFDFKYRFLVTKCANNGFFINEKHKLSEKVVINIIDNNWTYLFNRFWHATNWQFKTLLFSILLIITIFIYFGFDCIIKKIKK